MPEIGQTLSHFRIVEKIGQGIKKWWEGGVYDVSYVKDMKDGTRKIERLDRVLSKADYRPGKSYARPISVPLFSKRYPEDPAGPDRLCPGRPTGASRAENP
jgi:hypothetical protein